MDLATYGGLHEVSRRALSVEDGEDGSSEEDPSSADSKLDELEEESNDECADIDADTDWDMKEDTVMVKIQGELEMAVKQESYHETTIKEEIFDSKLEDDPETGLSPSTALRAQELNLEGKIVTNDLNCRTTSRCLVCGVEGFSDEMQKHASQV